MKKKLLLLTLLATLTTSVGVFAAEGNINSRAKAGFSFNFPKYQGGDSTGVLTKSKNETGSLIKSGGVAMNVSARCTNCGTTDQVSYNVAASSNSRYSIDYYNNSAHSGHNIYLRAVPQTSTSSPTTAYGNWSPDRDY